MAEPLTFEQKLDVVTTFYENVTSGVYKSMACYIHKYNRLHFTSTQMRGFNKQVGLVDTDEFNALLQRNGEEVKKRTVARNRQDNTNWFKANHARQAYASEHKFDRPQDHSIAY